MSVQFGRWNFEGQAPAPAYLAKVNATLAPFASDSSDIYTNSGMTMLYRAFHTTKESHRETQPHISALGAVITWDGRLDNRAELIAELRALLRADASTPELSPTPSPSARISSEYAFTDVEIVAGAYDKWGAECLKRLVGDWALVIWNPRERSLLLANDPTGTKHLYYVIEKDHVAWCTILDPLVLFAGRTFDICEEYVAGWFSHLPAPHLSPYVGIDAVPPSSFVLLRPGKHGLKRILSKHWDFDPSTRIRYHKDADYEEHFRIVFAQAVRRRLRSDRPVLAELSGGMDSSSIVCVADALIARGEAECPRLDTISWFDSSNPNFDDPAYFAIVERKRGCIGHHIDVCTSRKYSDPLPWFSSDFYNNPFVAVVTACELSDHFKQYATYMTERGCRVTLSGIGGEQPTGGCTPTPTPELQDLLSRGRLFTLARQLNAWAAKMRKARLPLLKEALRGFCPLTLAGLPEYILPVAPWLDPGFVRRNRPAFHCYSSKVKLFGPLPSVQEHLNMLACERRVLACFLPQPEILREIRFPYHDRDLREYCYAIPRQQLVGVGKRRFLMLRALTGILPDELLKRKPKASFPEHRKQNSAGWPSLVDTGRPVIAGSIGMIDPARFAEALWKAERNEEVHLLSLKRTVLLEFWLRHLASRGVLKNSLSTTEQDDPIVTCSARPPTAESQQEFS